MNFSVRELTITLFLIFVSVVPSLFVYLLIQTKSKSKSEKKTITIKKHSNLTKEFLLYLVSCTVPFILHDKFDYSDFIAIMIFIIAIGAIYLKSDMIFINPLFAFMNYKLHSVIDKNDHKYYILSKNNLYNDEDIKTVRIDRYFYVEQKK